MVCHVKSTSSMQRGPEVQPRGLHTWPCASRPFDPQMESTCEVSGNRQLKKRFEMLVFAPQKVPEESASARPLCDGNSTSCHLPDVSEMASSQPADEGFPSPKSYRQSKQTSIF